jgi:hypothetical protein
MCYMMSKQQYLSDSGKVWHPHLMFFVPGSVARSWGANLPGSPVMASDDPEEGATISSCRSAAGPTARPLRGRRTREPAPACTDHVPSSALISKASLAAATARTAQGLRSLA